MAVTDTTISYPGRDLEAMSFAGNYHRWVLRLFRPFIGEKIAEVGAGSGNFSSLLREEEIKELVAIEPSEEMYPSLRKKFERDGRVVTHQGRLNAVSSKYSEYFDSILYVNVLEHIEDEVEELKYAHQSLKQGGFLCIFVPALPFLYSEFDASVGHFRRYIKSSLRRTLEEAGFKIIKLSYFDILGIVPWFIALKLLKKKLAAGDVTAYDKLAVPVMSIIEKFLPVPIGKNLIAVGLK